MCGLDVAGSSTPSLVPSLHGVQHFAKGRAADSDLGLVFRCGALGGETLLLRLAFVTRYRFFPAPKPRSGNALSQFRDELAGNGAIHQTAQVGNWAGAYRFCLQTCVQFVEHCLRLIAATLDEELRRGPFFRKQALGEYQ